MLKDLIADKKKVDENLNKSIKGCNASLTPSYDKEKLCCGKPDSNFDNKIAYCDICQSKIDLSKVKSTELAKGISIATKLIEDEIKFLEDTFEYPMHNLLKPLQLRLESRIKYLKSLLEQ